MKMLAFVKNKGKKTIVYHVSWNS